MEWQGARIGRVLGLGGALCTLLRRLIRGKRLAMTPAPLRPAVLHPSDGALPVPGTALRRVSPRCAGLAARHDASKMLVLPSVDRMSEIRS